MKDYFSEIAKKIDSGEYFEEAKDWYQKIYIYPIIERSYFLLLTFISIFISIVAIFVLIDFLPLVNKIPIVVNIEDTAKERARISYLGLKGKKSDEERKGDANIVLMKYLINQYVSAREEYDYSNDFKKIERNKNLVKQFSSKKMFNDYKYNISIRNPKSFILRYRKHTKRYIKPLAETFAVSTATEGEALTENQKYTATINFVSREASSTKGFKNSSWKAKIDFIFSDVKYNHEAEEFYPLNFQVTGYKSKKIKDIN